MESPKVDVVSGPSTLILTKRSLQLNRGFGPSGCEVYPLVQLKGFRLGPSRGPDARIPNGSATVLILSFIAFAAALYRARSFGVFDSEFLIPAIVAFGLFLVAVQLASNPSFGPTMQYGLLITFHSGEDKLIPGRNEFEVLNVVAQFSEFMEKGAYLSHMVVENNGKGLQVTVERNCPC